MIGVDAPPASMCGRFSSCHNPEPGEAIDTIPRDMVLATIDERTRERLDLNRFGHVDPYDMHAGGRIAIRVRGGKSAGRPPCISARSDLRSNHENRLQY